SATAHTSNINCNGNAVVSSGNMTLGNFAGGQSFFYLADNRSFTLSSPGTVNCAAAGNGNLQIGTISVTNPNASLILNGGDLVLANGGNGTINSYGDLYLNSGTLSRTSGTGTIILRAQGASITTPKLQTITQGTAVVSGTISITFGIVGPSYSLVTLGSDVDFGPGSSTTVSSGSFLDFGNYTYTGLNFTQNSGANLITANVDGINTILTGNIGSLRTTNTRTMNASGQFIYNGTSPQETGTAVVSALYLSIFNTTGVTLSANCTIQTTGQLILNLSGLHGKLSLTNFNLTLSGTASILGASTNDYVVTNGTGRLVMPVSSADVTFPVGATTTTYNPLILNNAGGTADNYGVRVLNSTATPAPNDATKLVERYWVVTEGVAGGNSLAVSAEYNSGEDNVTFSAG
ncbi:MAG TPA: hypothetical protein PKY12_15255, partial [Catalimonadaceae bacterium]|nr:hypothetical protein [Catalimonadaceae bacterium]